MSRFSEVVNTAQRQSGIHTLQPVVEKELLHHEILAAMARGGLLQDLTFIGGTCLRMCYGSKRLSEDLDFTGGLEFKKQDLRDINSVVQRSIKETYDLDVEISDPKHKLDSEQGNVSTWKFQILTNKGSKHLPQQRIHVAICAVNSYQRQPMVLQNHYNIDLGTSGLLIQAETLHEIMSDKLLAFARRPNRIKSRDVWDLCWLRQQNQDADAELFFDKCDERELPHHEVQTALALRLSELRTHEKEFHKEMSRFLSQDQLPQIQQDGYWSYLTKTIEELCARIYPDILNG